MVATTYMPEAGQGLAAPDPYVHSMQWSRRFIGPKIFMSLAVAGWDGYAAVHRHQVAMGIELRARLQTAGWIVSRHTKRAKADRRRANCRFVRRPRRDAGADVTAAAWRRRNYPCRARVAKSYAWLRFPRGGTRIRVAAG